MYQALYQQILHMGKKPFVQTTKAHWTYDDLHRFCSFFHEDFKRHKHSKIMLITRQHFYAYSAIIATYFSGGTFCLVNPDLPTERKDFMALEFEPDLIICSRVDDMTTTCKCEKLYFEDLQKQVSVSRPQSIKNIFHNELLYVSFTSGSTGLPKGCQIKRTAFEQFCTWASLAFQLTPEDRYAQFVPLYFDMSLIDIFGGALHGVTLIPFTTFSEKLRPGPMIKKHGITFLNVVPQFLELLAQSNHLSYDCLQSLRMIRFGGDKIYQERLDQVFTLLPHLSVFSTYGPTEATCFCFYKHLTRDNYLENCQKIATIGQTIPGWYAYLKDPQEGIGEIVIYGNNIGAGYIHDHNHQNFRTEFIDGKEMTTYHTGDFAKAIEGNYYFEGRRDSQIKINGNRVSLVEVEYALIALGCLEVAALFVNNQIFCYFTSNEKNIDPSHLKTCLEEKLPPYALPSGFTQLEVMPHNANGKIHRSQLKKQLMNDIIAATAS